MFTSLHLSSILTPRSHRLSQPPLNMCLAPPLTPIPFKSMSHRNPRDLYIALVESYHFHSMSSTKSQIKLNSVQCPWVPACCFQSCLPISTLHGFLGAPFSHSQGSFFFSLASPTYQAPALRDFSSSVPSASEVILQAQHMNKHTFFPSYFVHIL